MASFVSAQVRKQRMNDTMMQDAIDCATRALERGYSVEKDLSEYVKKEFDKKYGHTWHVVAGRNFGFEVSYELNRYAFFYIGPVAFLLFRAKWHEASPETSDDEDEV